MIYLGTALLNTDGCLHFFYKEGVIYRVEVSLTTTDIYYSHWKHEVVSDVNDCEPFEYVLPNTLNIVRDIDTGDVEDDDN